MSLFQRSLIVVATVLAVASVIIAFLTLFNPQWIRFTVTDASFTRPVGLRHFEYYSRSRGLIWVCMTNSSAAVLQRKSAEVVLSSCFHVILSNQADGNGSLIVNLRRSHIGLKSAALYLILLGLISGLLVFMHWFLKRRKNTDLYRRWRSDIVVFWIIAVFLEIGSLAIFHYALDLEKYVDAPGLPHIYASWEAQLRQATTIALDSMYFLEWAAIGLLLLAAILMRESNHLFVSDSHAKQKNKALEEDSMIYTNNNVAETRLNERIQHQERANQPTRASTLPNRPPEIRDDPSGAPSGLRKAFNEQQPGNVGKNYVIF